jgi:hypothetical protein
MHVETTHHIDDVPGQRYEYDLFRFSDAGVTIVARAYSSSPREAHFLRLETATSWAGLTRADLARPLFQEAAAYLRSAGRASLEWLNQEGSGYEPFPKV